MTYVEKLKVKKETPECASWESVKCMKVMVAK